MVGTSINPEIIKALCIRMHAGEPKIHLQDETGINSKTLLKHYRRYCKSLKEEPVRIFKPQEITEPIGLSKILIYDIETLPNLGYFWDTFSDRSIPLDFVVKPKSICTIAYKWYGEPETYVLVIDTPYDDKSVLEAFLPEWSKANYVVAHYSRFDKPFIAARLMANGLPSLPPVNDICTYKLAKHHFGRSLNGNKLDHLGSILGVGNKIKTSADLWVKCAAGDKQAMQDMADYNKQDVDLLEKVFKGLLPHVKSKLNLNLLTDDAVMKCKHCGSDHLNPPRLQYTASTVRHGYLCKDCGSWSDFPRKAHA